jgi:hypothetical protein
MKRLWHTNLESQLKEEFAYQEGELWITNYSGHITAVRNRHDTYESNIYFELEDYEIDDTAILAYVYIELNRILEEQQNNTYDLDDLYDLIRALNGKKDNDK